jgi:hypothetical protein
MKKYYTWQEVQDMTVKHMNNLVMRIEAAEKANLPDVVTRLNADLANLNSNYRLNQEAVKAGKECYYVYYEGQD